MTLVFGAVSRIIRLEPDPIQLQLHQVVATGGDRDQPILRVCFDDALVLEPDAEALLDDNAIRQGRPEVRAAEGQDSRQNPARRVDDTVGPTRAEVPVLPS